MSGASDVAVVTEFDRVIRGLLTVMMLVPGTSIGWKLVRVPLFVPSVAQ